MNELIMVRNEAGRSVMADVCTQCDCRQVDLTCGAYTCPYRDGEMDSNYEHPYINESRERGGY